MINSESKIVLDRKSTDRALTALIGGSPIAAVRGGLIDLVLAASTLSNDRVTEALAPVCALAGVGSPSELPAALRALRGRPPRPVVRALRSREVVEALGCALGEVGLVDRSVQIEGWLTDDLHAMDLPTMHGAERAARSGLTDQYRERVVELMAGWRRCKIPVTNYRSAVPTVDGRALVAAARAWQLPELSPRSVLAPTSAPAAKHANRLGRVAATVAASRIGSLRSASDLIPVEMLEEALALLVAVAESIAVPGVAEDDPVELSRDARLTVRLGASVGSGISAMPMSAWWPVLDAWGATSRVMSARVRTVWRLSPVEGDVVVWALCSAASRLAVAAGAPTVERGADKAAVWVEHFESAWPRWEQGAQSVWALLQQPRRPDDRGAWPGVGTGVPAAEDPSSWPWRSHLGEESAEAGTLPCVPGGSTAEDFE